jgi:predicted glycoside hydrolase/deacetylase ChbG (UPF0249 family)
MARPRVVFVADDLGVTDGVNEGIARAARAGNVRECSLCVTGAAVEAGVTAARDLGIGIGLHLSLTLGRALGGPVRGLTDQDGRFRPLPRVLFACLSRRVDRAGVAREVTAQLRRLCDLGVAPSHLNGHHHVHVLPIVRDAAFAAAAQFGIRWTRMPDEHRAAGRSLSPARILLSRCARAAAPVARQHGLRWLPFVGLCTEARTDFGARAARLAPRLPDACEWMVHPRIADRALLTVDAGGYQRPAADELATLADTALAARLGVEPSRYGELDGATYSA